MIFFLSFRLFFHLDRRRTQRTHGFDDEEDDDAMTATKTTTTMVFLKRTKVIDHLPPAGALPYYTLPWRTTRRRYIILGEYKLNICLAGGLEVVPGGSTFPM